MNGPPAILIISHGSPREEANQGFIEMVGRIALRLGHAGCCRPSSRLPGRASRIAWRSWPRAGCERIVLMPYFLYAGQHIQPRHPGPTGRVPPPLSGRQLELLPTLENDPAVEDVVAERLCAAGARRRRRRPMARPSSGGASRSSTGSLAGLAAFDPAARDILRRIVHATADFSFARSLRVHPQAVVQGREALTAGRPVICDVTMVRAGLTKVRNEVLCGIDRAEVAAAARAAGCTRAAAAMELFAGHWMGRSWPWATPRPRWARSSDMARGGAARPALVVGLPVGLVGARESKAELLASDLVYITNVGPRGGSAVAAAALNALAAPREEA